MRWILPFVVVLILAAWLLDQRAETAMDDVAPSDPEIAAAPEAPILIGRTDRAAAASTPESEEIEVGIAVPLAYVHDRVFLPSGERAVDADAYIAVECRAVLVEGRPDEIAWQDLPIEVRASLDGFADLKTTFTLDDPTWTATLRSVSPEGAQR